MLKPRNLIIPFIIILSVSWFTSSGIWKRTKAVHFSNSERKHVLPPSSLTALKEKAEAVKTFVKTNSYDDQLCFLIDMSLPSGQNRFFVYDLKRDTIKNAGVVTHGR